MKLLLYYLCLRLEISGLIVIEMVLSNLFGPLKSVLVDETLSSSLHFVWFQKVAVSVVTDHGHYLISMLGDQVS